MLFPSYVSRLCFRARLLIDAIWSPSGKRLTSRLSIVTFNCVLVTFPCGTMSQVWELIVSIPDLCPLSDMKPLCVVHVRFQLHCFVFRIRYPVLLYFHFKVT